MRTIRHHKNPLLRTYTPIVYNLFRKRDCVNVPNDKHAYYHSKLKNNRDWLLLCAQAEELDSERLCDEFAFADALDEMWNTFLESHP